MESNRKFYNNRLLIQPKKLHVHRMLTQRKVLKKKMIRPLLITPDHSEEKKKSSEFVVFVDDRGVYFLHVYAKVNHSILTSIQTLICS
ncbi:hypothetical protein HYC85_007084 [Camellia sinensis]|uniref:Uncharacterized protein n=1 Tax=Camellia sinensis TaxID=4442 RepID=A0A7J7HQE3_CAMSI|nr:hypothetical protein HYC85_010356 [Camellia sinensis]KAF5954228.1 hypothetical protein HYC85_007084 [Camellia sinensis]